MSEKKIIGYGFIAREYVSLGEAPYKNVVKTVVSQGRLAEPIKILQQQDGWYEIEQPDTYRGWVSPTDVVVTTKEYWDEYQNSQMVLVTCPFTYVFFSNNDLSSVGKDATSIISGVTLATMLKIAGEEGEAYRVELPTGVIGYLPKAHGQVIPGFNKIPRGGADGIIALAKQFMGLPYYWGGTTPYGYDCSGLMQTMYKMHGIHLLRDAHQQFEQGEEVGSKEDLKPGDMLFWSTYRAGASHVGIYLGNNEYIHSGGAHGVAINSFDSSQAHYREDLDTKYLGARRVL